MNKKLIAVAIAGACAAPAAMAQTSNPVTLYGIVYLTAESIEAKSGPAGSQDLPRRTRIADQASRLGVRGTEDLGGGLKAFFQLETAFPPDQRVLGGPVGTSVCTPTGVPASGNGGICTTSNNQGIGIFNRNSAVGLQGNWGSILMGRWDTPFKVAGTSIDPYGDVTLGGISAVLNNRTNFDRREPNVIQYWSPTFAGINFRLHWGTNELRTNPTTASGAPSANPETYSGSVTGTWGPIYLFYTYEEHKNQSGLNSNFGLPTASAKDQGQAIGGTWAIGPVKIGAEYQDFKRTGFVKEKAWAGNVVWTIGNNQLSYQYQQSKDGQATTATTNAKCDMNAVGWQYNFSRRTFILAQYAKLDNKTPISNCVAGQNTPAGNVTQTTPPQAGFVAGQDLEGFSLGMRMSF